MGSRGTSKEGYYAVRVGRQTGVFRTWGECKAAVDGYSNARYKKFGSHAEASSFANSSGDSGSSYARSNNYSSGSGRSTGYYSYGRRSGSSGNYSSSGGGGGGSTRSSYAPAGTSSGGRTTVYTDGAAQGNGRANARGGVGVYFGPNDSRNVSEPLSGPRQTNQRAELTAIIRAMEQTPAEPGNTLHVMTDSQYSINCLTRWGDTWERNGWRTTANTA
ncbi:Ribonuclease H1, partial [Coemansia sp. RSA 2703]